MMQIIDNFQVANTIRDCLGQRNYRAKYKYEDVIISWMLANYCGAKRLEHVTKIGRSLNILSDLNIKVCSHDTFGRVMKGLATDTIAKPGTGKGNGKKLTYGKYNENLLMNDLLIKGTKCTGLLKENESYCLDMDATEILTECYEAEKNYLRNYGFFPMVSFIGKLPVYISMRGGNVAPSSEIKDCLENSIELLKKNKITVGKVRMDAAGFSIKALNYLHDQNIQFYVGGKSSPLVYERLRKNAVWEPITYKTQKIGWDCECTSIPYTFAHDTTEFRMVVIRTSVAQRKRPSKWIKRGEYAYKLVLTNDFESSISEILTFSNHRATMEHNFHVLKKHYNWNYPPFSFLNQNMVFFVISALANNIYQGVLKVLAEKLPELKLGNLRLNKFRRVFITVTCHFLNEVFCFDDIGIPYEKIM
ncbi:MAG: transposase, family [Bacteroidetes bacterium]|nr:transposase, family [Bacteroidota bacterium]